MSASALVGKARKKGATRPAPRRRRRRCRAKKRVKFARGTRRARDKVRADCERMSEIEALIRELNADYRVAWYLGCPVTPSPRPCPDRHLFGVVRPCLSLCQRRDGAHCARILVPTTVTYRVRCCAIGESTRITQR